MAEPGSKVPKAPKEDCWGIMCPVLYCSANPEQPCMNPKGFFSLKTHVLRRERYEKGQGEAKFGPGAWSRRPDRLDPRDFGHSWG